MMIIPPLDLAGEPITRPDEQLAALFRERHRKDKEDFWKGIN